MMRVTCKKCKRFFFETDHTVIIDNYQCPRCKETQNIKIVTAKTASPEELRYKFLNQGSESQQNSD